MQFFCWPLLDVTSTGLRRTPSPRFAFGQACLQPSNFLSHARHQTHHTARHFGIVDTLLLLHDNLHHTKTTHAHLHLLACHIPSGRCWARVVNSPLVPLDQHGHGRKSSVFGVTSDGKLCVQHELSPITSHNNVRRNVKRLRLQHELSPITSYNNVRRNIKRLRLQHELSPITLHNGVRRNIKREYSGPLTAKSGDHTLPSLAAQLLLSPFVLFIHHTHRRDSNQKNSRSRTHTWVERCRKNQIGGLQK